jgi:hypothetical protein
MTVWDQSEVMKCLSVGSVSIRGVRLEKLRFGVIHKKVGPIIIGLTIGDHK